MAFPENPKERRRKLADLLFVGGGLAAASLLASWQLTGEPEPAAEEPRLEQEVVQVTKQRVKLQPPKERRRRRVRRTPKVEIKKPVCELPKPRKRKPTVVRKPAYPKAKPIKFKHPERSPNIAGGMRAPSHYRTK